MAILLVIFLIALIISILVNVNLLFKVEKLEVDNDEMGTYIPQLEKWIKLCSQKINASYSQIKNIDRKGAFESDDEVGFIFKELKTIIAELALLTTDEKHKEENNPQEGFAPNIKRS